MKPKEKTKHEAQLKMLSVAGCFTRLCIILALLTASFIVLPPQAVRADPSRHAVEITSDTLETYLVNAFVSGEHGSVDPSTQTVNVNGSAAIIITPEAGYQISAITDNGSPAVIANPYGLSGITSDHNVVVTFAAIQAYTVNASVSGEHGSVDPATQTVNESGSATINIIPDTGYQIAAISDNGSPGIIANPYILETITADHEVVVTFDAVETLDTFTVNAFVSGEHGSVDPAAQTVSVNGSAGIIITPDAGYQIATITDNGSPAVITNPYVIDTITSDHEVVITFDAIETHNNILIVRLVAGLSPDAQQQVIARNGGVETSSVPVLRMHCIDVPIASVDEIIQRYQSDPGGAKRRT